MCAWIIMHIRLLKLIKMFYNSLIVRVKEVYGVHLIIIFYVLFHVVYILYLCTVRSPNIEDTRNPLDNRVFNSARQSLFIFYRISDLWRSLLHFTREEPRRRRIICLRSIAKNQPSGIVNCGSRCRNCCRRLRHCYLPEVLNCGDAR